MKLGLLAGVAPFGVEQPLGQMKQQGGGAQIVEMLEIEVDGLADDAGIAGDRGADQIGAELQDRIVVEDRAQALLRQLDAVAFHARKPDFQRIALGP